MRWSVHAPGGLVMPVIFWLFMFLCGFVSIDVAAFGAPPDAASPQAGPIASCVHAPGFDEAATKRHYDGWLLGWTTGPHSNSERHAKGITTPWDTMRDELWPLPDVERWPIDPARGMLANDIRNRPRSIVWELEGQSVALDPPPENIDWARIAISDWDDPKASRAVMCIPEACYYKSSAVSPKTGRVVIRKAGVWIALRKHDGKDVLAGILIHKTAPQKPLEDKLFKQWLAELATRYPLPAR